MSIVCTCNIHLQCH